MRAFLSSSRQRTGSCVGATYCVPLDQMAPQELEEEKARLTLQARTSYGAPPPPFSAWKIEDGCFVTPRFYGLHRFGPAQHDRRVMGAPIEGDRTFAGTLTEVQERAMEAIFSGPYSASGPGGTIVSLPCGYGKTVQAVAVIARIGVRALVIVHKAVLRDQWKEAFARFTPGLRIGVWPSGKPDFDPTPFDVVLAMVLTLAKCDAMPCTTRDSFGFVCIDEAHHIAAPVMHRAMRFPAHYVCALTATKDRPDGLTPLLHWTLGAEGFRVERDCEPVHVTVAIYDGPEREIVSRDGKPMDALILNHLARNTMRNAFIAKRVVAMRQAGRVIIVLSDRNAQLEALEKILKESLPPEDIGMFTGKTKDADRPLQLARAVVLTNYPMANEGLDKKELDTCIMATPKSRVVQCIGRIQRPCPTKKPPLVLDVADMNVLKAQRFRRQAHYSKESYTVQVLNASTAKDDEWYV